MKPDFDAIAADLCRRFSRDPSAKVEDLIRAQLALAYQGGVMDGLRQSEVAIKAAFDKFQGRVEP